MKSATKEKPLIVDAETEENEFWEYVRRQAHEIATRAHCELCPLHAPACRAKIERTADRIRDLVAEATDHNLPVIPF